jgi:predicted negative regulator of RcsB-dependent stress response
MVDDYLSDREQEEVLRSWWRNNWPWLIGGVVLGLALLAGWRYWTAHQQQQAGNASMLYENVQSALNRKDLPQASKALEALTDAFDRSAYAQQGRLLVAKAQADAGKFDDAAALLRSAAEKSKDEELTDVARLRLARILLQQGKYDDALSQLKPDALGVFAGPAREIRGDALLAKGDAEGARAEYAAALTGDDAAIDRTIVELKLQEVGGTTSQSSLPAATSTSGSKP